MIGIVLALMGLLGWFMGVFTLEQGLVLEYFGILVGAIETITQHYRARKSLI